MQKEMDAKIAIGAVVLLSTINYGVVGYLGYDPSREAQSIFEWTIPLLFAWWVLQDVKQRKFHRPYEFGAFIYFA